jgi:hypothetical protein
MKFRFFAVLAAVALMTGSRAHAQIGLYFNPVVSRISNSTPDTGPFAFLGSGSTSRVFGGVDFGGYYEFAHFAKFSVSADVRDTIQHGNSASINSFLVGPRIAARPLKYSLKPYIQLSFGDGRTRAPLSTVHVNKLEYNVIGGVDRSLSRIVDWRVIEVGYGSLTTISSSVYYGPTPIPAAKLLNFSTGFVFRIP